MLRMTPRRPRLTSGATIELGSIGANLLTLVLPLVVIQLFDRVIPNAAEATLTVLGAVLVGAVLVEAILRYAVAALLLSKGARYKIEAERRLLHQVLHPPRSLDEHHRSGLHFEAWETIERLRSFHASYGRNSAADLPFAIMFFCVFWMVAPPLLPVLGLILATALLATRLNRGSITNLNDHRRDHTSRLSAFMAETLGGAEHIKGLRAEPLMMRRHESLAGNAARVTEALLARQAVSKTMVESIGQATPTLVAISGAFWVNAGSLSTGALAAAILLSGRIVQPVLRARDQAEIRRALAPLKQELEEILDAPLHLGGTKPLVRAETLALENVTAATSDGTTILSDLSLELKAGECIAISGTSGSGKSTLMHLLSGSLTPSEGHLLINGAPIDSYPAEAVAAEIALLRQDDGLLSGSLLDVITSNRGESHLPQALAVAEELGLANFLATRNEGFLMETQAGARQALPGAMRGLLPIVAGLARQPSILLFDEANGALDLRSDQLVRSALERRLGSCILVLVTQRPSYIALADRQFQLEGGKLTEVMQPKAREMAS